MAGLKPHLNIPPGDFILEELESRHWTQDDLAAILATTPKTVSQLINGKAYITLDMAKRLAKAFEQSPQYWLNLDANYRLRLNEKASAAENGIAMRAMIYGYMPIREMVKNGWLLIPGKSVRDLAAAVTSFWDMDTLDFGFMKAAALPHCRSSEAHAEKFNPYFAYTWYHVARNQAKSVSFKAPWNRAKVEELARRLPEFTTMADGVRLFIRELNAAGVGFLRLQHLSKTYLDGAAFMLNGRPFVVYTMRFDRLDNFWFTMAHELGHILLHLGKGEDYFLDSFDGELKDIKEKEANQFAEGCMASEKIRQWGRGRSGRISEYDVRMIARQLRLEPSIVVGCLQHAKLLSARNLNKLKTPVSGCF